MPAYNSPKSDITGYDEPDQDSVIVEFRGGVRCLYDVSITGNDVFTLKRLLKSGRGARAWINRNKPAYQRV